MGRRAVIIGAGVSGLAAARGFLQQGWQVTIHERAACLSHRDSPLAMWPAAVEALRRAGLGTLVDLAASTGDGAALLRPDGTALATVASRTRIHLVDRCALLAHLAAGLAPDVVRWSSDLSDEASLAAAAEGADLLIGADGVNSPVRRLLLGHPARRTAARPLGSIAVRGTASGSHPVRRSASGQRAELLETWGRGAMWGTTPRSDGLTNTYACLRGDVLAEAIADPLGVLHRTFAGWHDDVRSPLEALDPDSLDVRALYDLHRLPAVVAPARGGLPAVVVLGDAAHAMAPHLGRGANEALLDADALCRSLAGLPEGSLGAALQRYDRQRRPPGHRAVLASRLAHHLSTARNGTGWRDSAVRLAGAASANGRD